MKVFEGANWAFEFDYASQAIAWAFCTTIPSTIPCSPGNLAFERDMTMNTRIKVDWELIKKLRHNNIIKNNIKENRNRVDH